MLRIGVALAVAASLTAPALAGAPADDLRDRLGAIFDTPDVNALWAAKVVSLDTGQVIFERNPRLLVMPASTMKVVTLAVAAERLGWDARFTTRLEATGPIEDGVLRGDSSSPATASDHRRGRGRAARARSSGPAGWRRSGSRASRGG